MTLPTQVSCALALKLPHFNITGGERSVPPLTVTPAVRSIAMSPNSATPTIEFYRFVEAGRAPQRADRAAGGTLPTRAFRYCEAATTASALGWYVFPPIGFRLLWTGTEMAWTYAGAPAWYPLGVAQFPGFREHFDNTVPERIKQYSPTFLAALPEPGTVQIWSGLVARTKPGWSLLARSPANMSRGAGYDLFEGVIEADRWFGPLFINIRLGRTNSPIDFDPNLPLFQVQPIQRDAYSDAVLNDVQLRPFNTIADDEWDDYYQTVVQPSLQPCPHGAHAAAVRKRRHAEALSKA